MKKSLFSWRLYVDGIKQLKIIGILFTGLISLVSAVIPVMNYLSTLDNVGKISQESVVYWEMNPLIILLFCAVSPLMTLYLFSFLNKRESSDFYHSIPETRPCLFFSFFASVMTWILAITVVSTLVTTIAYAVFPSLYLINYASIAYTCFNCFAGSLFIAACVALSMSVTGTIFTNLLVSLILIFFPRLLLELILMGIQDAFPLVSGLSFAPILSPEYNVPVGFIFALFLEGNSEVCLTQWQSGVYTLAVGLLYTAIAAVLFARRHSESAGHSAPSRRLQGLYRFLIGFVISCIATYAVFSDLIGGYSIYLDEAVGYALVYAVALIAALVFEVLCTRRFKGLLKKGLFTALLLVVANGAFIGVMFGFGRSLFLYTPNADDIDSVRIISGLNGDSDYYDGNSTMAYFSAATAKIELTDPAVREIVADQLQYTLDVLEISRDRYYKEYGNAESVTVAIKQNGITHLRRIFLYTKDMEQLAEKLYEVDEYRRIYSQLPENADSMDAYSEYLNYYTRNTEEITELYTLMKTEFAKLDFVAKYTLLNGEYHDYDEGALFNLNVRLAQGSQWYYFNLPIYADLMPETSKYLVNHANQRCNAADGLKTLAEQSNQLDSLTITVYNADGVTSSSYYIQLSEDTSLQQSATEWLNTLQAADATKNINTNGLFYRLSGDVRYSDEYDKDYYYYVTNYCFAKEPSGELPAWLATYFANNPSTGDDLIAYYD